MITIGSCFSGIGGFELGLERGIPNSKTIWQCEQDSFCKKILAKHWQGIPIYKDIREMRHGTIEPVDIICGGFPCQDISTAGKRQGIKHGTKSGLWYDMLAVIDKVRPKVIVLENVTAITIRGRGMSVVLWELSQIGYDVEWVDLRASDEGANHKRERIFFVAYPNSTPAKNTIQTGGQKLTVCSATRGRDVTNTNQQRTQIQTTGQHPSKQLFRSSCQNRGTYWAKGETKPRICRMDDGIPNRLDRVKALGNAIVPQCSERIGKYIHQSGLLNDIKEYRIQREIDNIPW